ncbi:C4-dicarboxylate ABC transporter substrate-binding protein [Pacificitalea manganoxidans]|uniref:C4-dicarboxylate ABC transporter substrate-binding protein n=1 Tax=Pacificitalea manganoxidans TaxID=1411902 RepID=A0A291LY46_9RHOB|nr:tripartite tricarboxylate transporter substrate binding protein [Pacificitalea manganoxidans]MAQ44424.1 tripartite tricarboxylate transporter substrate binding protein [Actibacterium sp.]OWU71194.1 C4-dicarboxylate ABC transporter substrate-binding protein [Roseovarius sp. 22II1-1F6A]ATI41574.1 C4-dicarboxylate ABC transporter substrate-binding protein [Pacificitalea manganoxidans]MBF51903.1 tripartite tricarboxylate transporter substrate binding protein [Actibacterium sp.]MDR6309001.1 trip
MRKLTLVAAVFGLAAGIAQAQDFPPGAVDYVIPFGPGGESDITARLQQPYFKKLYGEELVVSYKPGGGGAVGWSQLNSMADDGSVIMGVNLPHIIVKPEQGNVGFTTDDITNVYMFHYTPDAIVVKADSPFETLDDLIAAAKADPRKVTFSGSGKGTANHLVQVKFDNLAEIETTYVSFKGTGAAVTAMLGGQVAAEWGYSTVGAAQGDKVRMLAVATEERQPAFPDVPTFKELGFDIVSGAYRGIAVPNGASEETRQQVSDAIAAINADPEFRQKMLDGGFALVDVPYGPEMDAFMAERAEDYLAAAKAAGVID